MKVLVSSVQSQAQNVGANASTQTKAVVGVNVGGAELPSARSPNVVIRGSCEGANKQCNSHRHRMSVLMPAHNRRQSSV